jgi:hypothetical protein
MWQVAEMEGKRAAIVAHMDKLLADNGLLILPAAAGPAPRLNTPPSDLDSFRTRLISLTCIAGLAKLPQVPPPSFAPHVVLHLWMFWRGICKCLESGTAAGSAAWQ